MNNINYLEIENFKSIKHLRFDCKRVNLFIGKPNVGKSNILEALGLYSAYYEVNQQKYLSSFIRYNHIRNLFYDENTKKDVSLSTNLGVAVLKHLSGNPNQFYLMILDSNKTLLDKYVTGNTISEIYEKFRINKANLALRILNDEHGELEPLFSYFDNDGSSAINGIFLNINTPVKKFDFLKLSTFKNLYDQFLLPPNGNNLFAIVAENKNLSKEIRSFFEEYGLQLILKVNESEFEILKNIDGIGYSYPYISVADTLQRIIFYLAAIESNKDSVLVFEEPEAHAYPPYTSLLAERISNDKDNQYFITTHSPYLLNTIISNTPSEDLCVYLTYYENYETKVKLLPHDKLREMLDEGFDVFSQFRYLMDEYALGN